ncbi:MAG: hypothetical protein AAGK92_06075 [Pseudomonadota bacterium]
METLVPILIILNITLATALFVARIAQRDAEYARQAREEEEFKSYFRNDRRR